MNEITPANAPANDSGHVEVGTRFTSDVTTNVVGVRYWYSQGWFHAPQVNPWQNGTLLASATFSDPNVQTGWFELLFSSPVQIQANTEYVVSGFGDATSYGSTPNYFTSPYSNGTLHAPANAGVYIYNSSSAFPTNQTSTNFWVSPITDASASIQVSAIIDPEFTFTVANRSSACNGESGFVSGAGTSTAVGLGYLAVSSNVSGGQALSVTSNAGNGFSVYIRGTQASQNLRSSGHYWSDAAGTYASPAALGSGERFGYTWHDSTASSSVTNPSSASFAALTNAATNAVMGSTTSETGSACVSYDAQAGSATPAGSYIAAVIYTALPTF
jgi:uncharacterized protein DUF4082